MTEFIVKTASLDFDQRLFYLISSFFAILYLFFIDFLGMNGLRLFKQILLNFLLFLFLIVFNLLSQLFSYLRYASLFFLFLYPFLSIHQTIETVFDHVFSAGLIQDSN